MEGGATSPKEDSHVGLCCNCQYARRIESGRGSVFFLCELSSTKPQFPKYPRLPIFSCPGYSPNKMSS